MNKIYINLVVFLHALFVLFVLITPFTSQTQLLLFHIIIIPFIIFHWYLNDNTCILTIIEKKLREKNGEKINKDDCFTCKLIHPIYDFKGKYEQQSTLIYIITLALWLLSIRKMWEKKQKGEIKDIIDLFLLTPEYKKYLVGNVKN